MLKSMCRVTQLLRAGAGFTLRSGCFSKAPVLPTPARNKRLISQSLPASGRAGSWPCSMIKPVLCLGSSACVPTQCPHHYFALSQLSLSFKIFTDKAISRGRQDPNPKEQSSTWGISGAEGSFAGRRGSQTSYFTKGNHSPGKRAQHGLKGEAELKMLSRITWGW